MFESFFLKLFCIIFSYLEFYSKHPVMFFIQNVLKFYSYYLAFSKSIFVNPRKSIYTHVNHVNPREDCKSSLIQVDPCKFTYLENKTQTFWQDLQHGHWSPKFYVRIRCAIAFPSVYGVISINHKLQHFFRDFC